MKVALVVPAFELGGGVPTVGHFLREVLLRQGHEVGLFSLSTSWRAPDSTHLLRPWEWMRSPTFSEVMVGDGAVALRIGARFAEWEVQRYQPRKIIRELMSAYDFVQVVAGSAVWANACRDVGRPVFLQVATTLAAERAGSARGLNFRTVVSRFATRCARSIEIRSLASVTGVFVENKWMEDFVRKVRRGQGVYFAPPGVDTEYFHPPVRSARDYILFVGRVDDSRKNVDMLLRSFAACADGKSAAPRLVLAGLTGPSSDQRSLIQELGIARRVEIRIRPTREELRYLYQNAAFVTLSSREEGLGMVLLEAMACGTPVVSTDCGGPRTVVIPEENGLLVPNGDMAALSAAMERLWAAPSWARQLGIAGRQGMQEHFSYAAAGRRFDHVYRAAFPEAFPGGREARQG